MAVFSKTHLHYSKYTLDVFAISSLFFIIILIVIYWSYVTRVFSDNGKDVHIPESSANV